MAVLGLQNTDAQACALTGYPTVTSLGEGETTCPSAARIRITAPVDTTALTLTQPFTPCGGRVRVSPFRPTESDVAPPASV